MFENVRLKGDFTLSSGKRSKYYYDFSRLPPHKIKIHAKKLLQDTMRFDLEHFPFVATASIGGICLAAFVAEMMGLPLIIVDKDNDVRGIPDDGLCDNFLFIDDVISTYGTADRVQKALGCKAAACASFVFRGKEVAQDMPTYFLERKEIEG